MSQQCKFFPGWFVVASGFVIMATCYTVFVNCMSLFQPLIVSDLGISLAQYTISNAHGAADHLERGNGARDLTQVGHAKLLRRSDRGRWRWCTAQGKCPGR